MKREREKKKKNRLDKVILKEKNEIRGLILSDFKTYCKAVVIKLVWFGINIGMVP